MKKYQKPIIYEQQLDREVSLILESDPPQPGDDAFQTSSNSDDTSTSSKDEESTKENNFDDNPFER